MTAQLTDKFGALVKSIEALGEPYQIEQSIHHRRIKLAMRRVSDARAAEILRYLEVIQEIDRFFDGLEAQLAAIQPRKSQ